MDKQKEKIMDVEERQKLKNLIIKHEGYREFVYTDTTGHPTIGFGHNLEARGLSLPICAAILDEDIQYWIVKLTHLVDFFADLDFPRKAVLIDMCHNLGINGLLGFHEMLDAMRKKDYDLAYTCMMDSKWAQQVGHRAVEDAYIIKQGQL